MEKKKHAENSRIQNDVSVYCETLIVEQASSLRWNRKS